MERAGDSKSDPTGITLVIVIVFVVATLWARARAHELSQQRVAFEAARSGHATAGWAAEYWAALALGNADQVPHGSRIPALGGLRR